MTWALTVIGNGRLQYLHQTVQTALGLLPEPTVKLMVDDSGSPEVQAELDAHYPTWGIAHHPENRGMAAAVQTGFDLVCEADTDFALWLEEDMLLTRTPPLKAAMDILDMNDHLAQMCFRRATVWGNPYEDQHGDVLAALCAQSTTIVDHGCWTEYDALFSLNPCLIPQDICQIDWDAGNEAGMTTKLRDKGYRFGSWGVPSFSEHWVTHIGEQRGHKWQL